MLKVENIDLAYGAAKVLRSVSVEAEIGQVSCVLGRNGVGKTSLLRAIVGHQPISAGRITARRAGHFDGCRPTSARGAASATCRRAAKSFPLLTVRENLETGFAPLAPPRSLCSR